MPLTKLQVYMLGFLALVIMLFIGALSINTFLESWIPLKLKPQNTVANRSTSKVNSRDGDVAASSINTKRMTRKWSVFLVYTAFFGMKPWFRITEDCKSPQLNGSCSKDLFDVTYDKRRFPESDYVMFHARDMPSSSHMTMIWKKKPSSQLWIYFLQESPNATPDPTPLNGMFDITFTYRADSDFWAPYGSYEEFPLKDISQEDLSVGKTKLVSWMVSNCNSQLRKLFVHELQKYIVVDVFGRCSGEFGQPKSCPKETCKDILKKYKFYLSFENAMCKDYITEKYWAHLGDENIVPVVMGGADYSKLAIPGSYINVLDFSTVKDLADYLHYLDKNSTAYNEYFKWRQRYRGGGDWSFLCQFCRKNNSQTGLHFKSYRYQDLTDFWVTQGKCNDKDQLVRKMWTHSSKFAVYFSLSMTFILIAILAIALMIYYTQIYKEA